jgi:hypothetical protein
MLLKDASDTLVGGPEGCIPQSGKPLMLHNLFEFADDLPLKVWLEEHIACGREVAQR